MSFNPQVGQVNSEPAPMATAPVIDAAVASQSTGVDVKTMYFAIAVAALMGLWILFNGPQMASATEASLADQDNVRLEQHQDVEPASSGR